NEYSRGDHKHPLQVSDVLPSKDTSVGTVGQASSYARSDHQHPIQTVNTIPVSDSADGSYGTVDSYSRNDHSHPINVEINASNIPIVDGVGNNGTSAYYSRHDHIHPQQLTYDGNVTATKFIKSGRTASEILCANGDTTTIANKISREYNASAGGWIILCNFPAITPVLEVLLYPKKIAELPVLSSVLDILKPSSKLVAVGFIQNAPQVTPANVFIPVMPIVKMTDLLLMRYLQVLPIGLTYNILFIIPPLAKSQVIGIYVPFATPQTTSYVNISVILLVQQVLQSDTTIVTLPADSNLTYAEQIADVPDPE
ncbi:MAG: hypothetical protein EZS28_044092, partial [Streblomastix strix]